jgi:hypothetical protein
MSSMKPVLLAAAAAALVTTLVACSGGNDRHDPVVQLPQGGEGVVTVSVGAGAFNGFDVVLDYPEGVVSPVLPVADGVSRGAMAAACTCEAQQVGTTLRFSCVSAQSMGGPGVLAEFDLHYPGRDPMASEFAVTCVFYDQDGNQIARTCSLSLET